MTEKTELKSIKTETEKEKEIELREQVVQLSQQNQLLRMTVEKLKNIIISREVDAFDRKCAQSQSVKPI